MLVAVIGPENILFAAVCVHHSAWTFYRLGAVIGYQRDGEYVISQ